MSVSEVLAPLDDESLQCRCLTVYLPNEKFSTFVDDVFSARCDDSAVLSPSELRLGCSLGFAQDGHIAALCNTGLVSNSYSKLGLPVVNIPAAYVFSSSGCFWKVGANAKTLSWPEL